MKPRGIIRRIDSLGRLVLPKEMRDALDINESPIEIIVEEDKIILRKFVPNCVFCQGTEGLEDYMGRLVCEKCRKALGGK